MYQALPKLNWRSIHKKKLSKTEAELEKSVAYKSVIWQ